MKHKRQEFEISERENEGERCHTWFYDPNRVLIVCVPKNQVYTHTI
jgi:hypothetical protein